MPIGFFLGTSILPECCSTLLIIHVGKESVDTIKPSGGK